MTSAIVQHEVNVEFNTIIGEILEDPLQQVTSAQIKNMINMMRDYFKFFKSAFINLIDKILTIEERDNMIKGIYKLLEKFMGILNKQNSNLSLVDVSSLIISTLEHLLQIYHLPKVNSQVQIRAAFILTIIVGHFGLFIKNDQTRELVKLSSDLRFDLADATIDMLHSQKSTVQLYGVQLAAHQIASSTQKNEGADQVYLHLMQTLTHCKFKEVRKAILHHLRAPFSSITLMFIGKRLRDNDDDVRRMAYQKLHKNGIKIEDFQSKEQRMLIIKEGLTDSSEQVRLECIEFLRASLNESQGDLSFMFKQIDCKKMFIKEYYIQLPFIIMRFIFHSMIEDELKIANYMGSIIKKLKQKAGLIECEGDSNMNEEDVKIDYEEILFLRIGFEFSKMYRKDRSEQYVDLLDQMMISFDEYQVIFNYLLKNPDYQIVTIAETADATKTKDVQMPSRLLFAEWVKFSLQLSIEEEVTRRNLVSLMFSYIGQIKHSYQDYQHLLKHKRFIIKDQDQNNGEHNDSSHNQFRYSQAFDHLEYDDDDLADITEDQSQNQDDQVIEIEIRAFQDLNMQRDIQEYCKPFSFESLVLDSDDVCRIAVIVARKLLDARIDEFSLSMLQSISDIKEPIEDIGAGDDQPGSVNFKKYRDLVYKKLESKLESVNELILQEDYSISELNEIMRKVRGYVNMIEEINLKEKLCYKRALNMCLILLKQCRADVNDQNLISLCDTLIGPTIQTKDKDNMLLAIECIGLLCLLDKELFQNYSKIFQRILVEDVMQDNLREKIIALKSSVDSLIIHGVDQKTQKLQKIIIEDYMVIKDKILRQITIEGICKMLFSRKLSGLTSEGFNSAESSSEYEIEFLLSQLIIQWFDKKFNWQNSLVRQILNTFFKSFGLFSVGRCEIMMRALVKVIYSILMANYGDIKHQVRAGARKMKAKKKKSSDDDSDDYSVDEDDEYNSDDSRCLLSQALMQNIVKQLDPVQISKIFLLLLSKDYVNQNSAKDDFKLTKNLTLEFLYTICYLNHHQFKKVAIVKDYISLIVDYVDVNSIIHSDEDWCYLQEIGRYIELNLKMLVQGNPKLKRIKELIDKRVEQLRANDDDRDREEGRQDEIQQLIATTNTNKFDQNKQNERMAKLEEVLEKYFREEILDVVVDLVQDDDQEYQELQTLQQEGLNKSMYSPFALKNNNQRQSTNSVASEQSNQNNGRVLRKRRSGLRSNKKSKHGPSVTVGITNKLRAIPEVEEMKQGDISSSEKPQRKGIKNLLCETIIEEKGVDQTIDLEMKSDSEQSRNSSSSSSHLLSSDDDYKNNQQYQSEREKRQGIMSKLSKKMARDFAQNKKKSLLLSQSGGSYTQINEQRLKEEYVDGRTVFKISKQRSISPVQNNNNLRDKQPDQNMQNQQPRQNNNQVKLPDSDIEDQEEEKELAHNLSVRFDKVMQVSDEKRIKNHANSADQQQNIQVSSIKKQLAQQKKKSKAAGGAKSSKDSNASDFDDSVDMIRSALNNHYQQKSKPTLAAQRGVVSKNYENKSNLLQPPQYNPKNLMTRSRMRSVSSYSQTSNQTSNQKGSVGTSFRNQNSSSLDSDSADDEEDTPSNDAFGFMQSNITKNKKEALKKQNKSLQQMKRNEYEEQRKIIRGKRNMKDYKNQDSDNSMSRKENKRVDNKLQVGKKASSNRSRALRK